MEQPEVPTEHLQEEIHHRAQQGERWTMGVALSSALLAGLAAIASLKAGDYANESMLAQIQCANQWNRFQSKSIKASQLSGKMEILSALGKQIDEKDKLKAGEYKKEQDEIKNEAENLQSEARTTLLRHETLARSVTLFQIAIAVGAISVLAKRRRFWMVSLAFGLAGVFFLIQGLIHGWH